ncbi:MAG: PQQ-dependent sugar dehydrogenase [Verrucomicrobiota bacterium]
MDHRFHQATASGLTMLFFISTLTAQNRIGEGEVVKLYNQHCAVCHGKDFNNGLGGSLLEDWNYVNTDNSVEDIIANGIAGIEMPQYKSLLTDEEIRSLAILLDEKRHQHNTKDLSFPPERDAVFKTRHHSFRIETLASSPEGIFWAVDFLPDGTPLVTGFEGQLYVFGDGKLSQPVRGTPEVWRKGQGGLLDVGVHPDYDQNGWIYLSYAEELGSGVGTTSVVRGKIRNGKWVEEESIFQSTVEDSSKAGAHFGSRFVFDDGYLFFGIGDRGSMHDAQDIKVSNGKIHRIHDDGRVPDDNPFSNKTDAFKTIWSYGNRNPQGLTKHPETGDLWESEHGPRGGDEINRIEKGKNYGWPVISYGMNYNGKPITALTKKEGMEQPATHFTPSIAICGTDFYIGDQFPAWNHHLFTGGLAAQELWRLETDGGKVVDRELVLKNQGRVRDVRASPDGYLYLILTRSKRAGGSDLCRLIPE